MNTLLITVNDIADKLHQRYEDATLCHQYAWWMLEAVTGKTQAQLLAHKPFTLSSDQKQIIQQWINLQVQEKKPLQYLLGYVPFAGLELLVESPILIPRPETEEWTIQLIEQLQQLDNQKITILDLATGSGCVALALAKMLPQATIWASDISPEAITLAQKNAQYNNITNVKFIISDLFAQLPKQLKFDLIVSNPPYIAEKEWQKLDASVTQWEDKQALIANHEGLAIIEKIITQAVTHVKINKEFEEKGIPQLVIEIGYQQAQAVTYLMEKQGYTDIYVHKDLAQKNRVVSGRIVHVAISGP